MASHKKLRLHELNKRLEEAKREVAMHKGRLLKAEAVVETFRSEIAWTEKSTDEDGNIKL